jgi:hypothetical protein
MTLFNFSSLPRAVLGASAFVDYLQAQGSKHGKRSFKCGIRSLPRVIPPFRRVNSFVGMVLWVPKRVSAGFFAQRFMPSSPLFRSAGVYQLVNPRCSHDLTMAQGSNFISLWKISLMYTHREGSSQFPIASVLTLDYIVLTFSHISLIASPHFQDSTWLGLACLKFFVKFLHT